MRILFYEKPGCVNNTKQKKMLQEAGHELVALSLLEEAWSETRLREFFGDKPVNEWFNMSAPQIKSGEVNPAHFTEEEALKAMTMEPLLIKRPLIDTEWGKVSGFDNELVNRLIGYKDTSGLHSCPNFLNRCS